MKTVRTTNFRGASARRKGRIHKIYVIGNISFVSPNNVTSLSHDIGNTALVKFLYLDHPNPYRFGKI